MSAPVAPPPGETTIVAGDTVVAYERDQGGPLYEVRGMHGVRMTHWCWEAICHCCWGWVAKTIGGTAAVHAWHAGRFGRSRDTFHIDGSDIRIESWAVITDWHVVLFLEGGRRVEVDRDDSIIRDSYHRAPADASERARLSPPRVPAAEDSAARHSRAIFAGEASSAQMSLFGGAS